jgi:hypothetical protein
MRRLPHRNAILGRKTAPEEPRSPMAATLPKHPAIAGERPDDPEPEAHRGGHGDISMASIAIVASQAPIPSDRNML